MGVIPRKYRYYKSCRQPKWAVSALWGINNLMGWVNKVNARKKIPYPLRARDFVA